MNILRKITLFSLAGISFISVAQAQLKIATVDMNKLFEGYHKTDVTQQEINVERARVQKENDERLTKIRGLETDIKDLRKKLEDPTLGDSKKQELAKSFEEKRQEGIALDRERREFLQRRNAALMEKTRQDMKVILDEINEVVEVASKSDNYDYVFNKTAAGVNQVPFLLYSKDAVDITEVLATKLNENAPPKD